MCVHLSLVHRTYSQRMDLLITDCAGRHMIKNEGDLKKLDFFFYFHSISILFSSTNVLIQFSNKLHYTIRVKGLFF